MSAHASPDETVEAERQRIVAQVTQRHRLIARARPLSVRTRTMCQQTER